MDTLECLRAIPGELKALTAEVARLRERLDAVTPSEADGYLSLDAAAELSGLSRGKVEKAVAAGELASVKQGRRRLVQRRRLIEWMERGAGPTVRRGRG
jgi:excisionase family DNA binding protein